MNKLGICVVLIIVANCINAQKLFTFSVEAGAIQPIPIFYKGVDSDSNEDRKISGKLDLSAGIHCNWHYDRKSFLSLGVYYETYKLDIKEYVIFPEQITPEGLVGYKSYLYSNFDVKNLGLRASFGNILSKKIKLNTGFQVGFPLNNHFGYIYEVGKDTIIITNYNYLNKNPFTLFANVTYQWYQTKKIGFILVPEISYNLQKDAKTYIHENQIRKICFALRVGINFKS